MTISIKTTATVVFASLLTAGSVTAATVTASDGGTTAYSTSQGVAIDFDATPAPKAVWTTSLIGGQGYQLMSVALKNDTGNSGTYYLGVYTGLSGGVLSGFQGVSDSARDFSVSPNDWMLFTFSNLNHTVTVDSTVGSGSGLRYFVFQSGTSALAAPNVVKSMDRFGADTYMTNSLASIIAGGGLVAARSPQYVATIMPIFQVTNPPTIAALRRPISPNQPMWLLHIDTPQYADPQKIIDLIPQDIRPYVVMNVSLSVGAQNGVYSTVEYPYETAKSWVRTCAENNLWCTVQVASGGYARFSDGDISQYEEFYRDFPNVIGFNYAEQFWGFSDIPRSPFWTDRVAHWVELMKLNQEYGGYLIVSWCGQGSGISPIAMFKKNPEFAAICQQSPQHFILTEKYTTGSAFQDTESVCLGSYLSGFSGNYGIRFDNGGWSNSYETNTTPYPTAVSAPAHLEHIMLTGETVIDGPELIWAQCFYESSAITTPDGYKARKFNTYSQFDNVSVDIFRKVLDGTIRIPTRQEVVERTKVAIVNDVNSASDVDIYSAPTDLFLGLYQMDDDGSFGNNKSWFKKTGRYPAIPTVFQLSDATAQSFAVPVNRSSYTNRWPTMAAKTNEFNSLFPQEYTGDMYAGRLENGWVVYNPYKTNQTASASIPFKYNTCDQMELTFDRFSSGVIKEYSNSLSFYLQNFGAASNSVLYTDTIKIYGSTSAPTWSYTDRASHLASIVTSNWSGGVFTLTVQHNGALDITVNCAGTATSRLTNYTAATLVAPAAPPVYPGPRQYEGECFDYKNVAGNVVSGYNTGVSNYTGQGYLKFGTSSGASVRDLVSVLKTGTYRLETRYSVTNVSLSSIDLYVNGVKVATPTFTQTASYSDWAVNKLNISLNAGTNTIEFRANATGASSLYFDNMVLVPTAYGDGIVVQEYQSGFGSVDGIIESTYSGYTGTGYANTIDSAGARIDWALNFDSSFTKSFTFRYAATTDATADLYVNGTNVASNIQFKSTGVFSAWDYVTVYAEVPAGSADVRLQAVSSTGLPNVDSLEIIGGTPWYAGNVPFVPLGLTATSISISQINLAWSVTPGAVSYNVKRASMNGGPYTTIATGVTSPGYTNTGLSTLTTYYYVVSAVNVTGESANSAPASATTKSTVTPTAPTGLSAVAVSYHQANLSWTGSLGVDYYIVKRSLTNGGPYITVAVNVTGTNFSDAGLFAGKTYYYVVSGVNNNGEGANSSQASTTTPSTFTMEPIEDAYVEAGSSVGSYFGTSDQLKVKNQGLDANVTRVTYLKFNVQNLSDATSVKLGLTPYQIDGTGITNRFEVVTNDSWTERTIIWSNQPGGAGIVITNLRSSNYSLGNQILIDVTSNAVNQATNDGYLSLLISDPYTNATLIGFWSKEALLTNTHPVLVSTLVQNHPAPATPTGLAATPVTDTRIDLSWTPASGASSYNVQRASVSGGPYTLIATGVSGTNYSDTGLSASTTYYYVVGAMNGAGASANSTQASATTHAFPLPAAPTSLTAVGATTNRINLSWNTSSGAASYNVKRSLTNGGPYAVVATGVTATYFNDIGLAADTTYYYVVSALNSTGESADSAAASATTLAGVVTLLSSTTGLYPVTTGVGVTAGTFDLDDSANALVVGVYIDANNILCLTNLTTFGGVPPSGLIQAPGGGGNRMFALYWLNPNTAPGQTLVIAANASANIQAGYYALQLAGVDTNAAVVKTGAATTDANNVNLTTTTANSFVVSFYSANASGLTLTPTAPLTSLGATLNTINGGGGGSLAAGTNVLVTAGTQNLAWTSSGSTANQGVNGLAFAPYTGSLMVGPSGPEHLTNSYSASTGILSLSWPAGEGWRLQMQTNSLAAGLGTNWVDVTDGAVSSTNITVNPANGAVFYRLKYP